MIRNCLKTYSLQCRSWFENEGKVIFCALLQPGPQGLLPTVSNGFETNKMMPANRPAAVSLTLISHKFDGKIMRE